MDEAISTSDGSGCVDPDGVPGSQPLAESSPATATAAAAAADVEIVLAPNQEETRERPEQAQREAKRTSYSTPRTNNNNSITRALFLLSGFRPRI